MSTFIDRFDDVEKEQEELLKAEGKKIRNLLRAKDRELNAERAWDRANMCPNCHIVLTKLGFCTNGCGYKKDNISVGVRIGSRTRKVEKDAFQLAREKRDMEKAKREAANPVLDIKELESLMKGGLTLEEALNKLMP